VNLGVMVLKQMISGEFVLRGLIMQEKGLDYKNIHALTIKSIENVIKGKLVVNGQDAAEVSKTVFIAGILYQYLNCGADLQIPINDLIMNEKKIFKEALQILKPLNGAELNIRVE